MRAGSIHTPARELIVVLGRPLKADGRPTPGLERRLSRALEEARRRPEAPVFVTGGPVESAPEGPAMARWLVEQGLAPERVKVDDTAMHTVANCERTVEQVAALGAERVVAVTDTFHQARATADLRAVLDGWSRSDVEIETVTARTAPEEERALRSDDEAKIARDLGFIAEHLRAPESHYGALSSPVLLGADRRR